MVISAVTLGLYKPVGDRYHEVLGMGSFVEYKHDVLVAPVTSVQGGLNTELVYFGI
jgi:hypothetical protein